jgi:hypothetical protein
MKPSMICSHGAVTGRKFIGRIKTLKKLIVGGAKMSKSLENSLLKKNGSV